ncbi:hypothetical protein CHELA40_11040 [Chelatococcus asaccharovorans]|nr:hypothetical protein CHELA40_11040 [Chelatococcus asaccharovorans]CAH1685539.1 hypothetical protein CHELA17_64557 [Chelatococcus asaccharovorans]
MSAASIWSSCSLACSSRDWALSACWAGAAGDGACACTEPATTTLPRPARRRPMQKTMIRRGANDNELDRRMREELRGGSQDQLMGVRVACPAWRTQGLFVTNSSVIASLGCMPWLDSRARPVVTR